MKVKVHNAFVVVSMLLFIVTAIVIGVMFVLNL